MSDDKISMERYKQLAAENAAAKWAIKRGINNHSAIELLAKDIQETTVIKDGCLESYGGRPLDDALTGAFYSSDILKHHFSDQVRSYEASSQQQPSYTRPDSDYQEEIKVEDTPYFEMSTVEKITYRNKYGDEAFSRLISDAIKHERERKKGK